MEQQLKAIGLIRSSLHHLSDCPLQESENAPEASVEIFEEFAEGMKDFASGDRLLLFTWLHQADRTVLTTRPRNDLKAPITGVFSTRSPDRPNPIGMHRVTVTSIEGRNKFTVSQLEVLDQTPLIDVKSDLTASSQPMR